MGYYIETDSPQSKAHQLLTSHPEIKIVATPTFDYSGKTVNVCVVENGPFDAAAVAYSEREMQEFLREDGRPKTWLLLPRELVIKLCPEVAKRLI